MADLIEAHFDELAELETLDQGKPVWVGRYAEIPVRSSSSAIFAGQAMRDRRHDDPDVDQLPASRQALFAHVKAADRRGRRDRSLNSPIVLTADEDRAGTGPQVA